MLQKLETILLEKNTQSELAKDVVSFYGSDLNQGRLFAQLCALHSNIDESVNDLRSLLAYLKGLKSVEREFILRSLKQPN